MNISKKSFAIGTFVLLLLLFKNINLYSSEKSRFKSLELFNKVLFLIESQYYREVDSEKLIQGAIKGMMSTLDPHSNFLDKNVFSKMQEETSGEYGGLGLEVTQKDGSIIVITAIDDTPAYKAGMLAGDRIVQINHSSIVGLTLDEIVDKMKGKINSKIVIGVVRKGVGGVKHFELTRKIIKVKPVKSYIVSDSYIFIRLTQFQKRSAKSIIEALKRHKREISKKKRKLRGIVLDLRSNPGGLLDEAVKVSSIFLKSGIVVSTENRDPKNKEIKYVLKSGYKDLKTPLAVMLNGSSASASEIVAGALQDHKRGVVMGSTSFGKGSVQTVAKLDESQGVKLTIAQYMTPKNRKIQAIGIVPDIEIPEFAGDFEKENLIIDRYVREKDLRNHLTATIESPSEKKMRIKKEQEDRKKRIERIKKQEASKKKKKEPLYKDYHPKKDFQVLRVIKHMQTIEYAKSL